MDVRCLILAIRNDRDPAAFIDISVTHTRVEAQRREGAEYGGRPFPTVARRDAWFVPFVRTAMQAGLRARELRSAVRDDRFLIFAIMEDRKNHFIGRITFPRSAQWFSIRQRLAYRCGGSSGLRSADMDIRFLIFAIKDDRKTNFLNRLPVSSLSSTTARTPASRAL